MEIENQDKSPQNGITSASEGSSTTKSQAQGEKTEIKEGDPSQQRPQYGSDAGANTSTRDDQLPSLNDGAAAKSDSKELST
jgi:hypothetical protein